ncbi:cation transporter [Bacteroidota bacterium]
MKVVLFLLIPAFLLGACSLSDSKSSGDKSSGKDTVTESELSAENLTQIHLDVKGMTCEGCENAIVASIEKLDGIKEASASHTGEEAVIVYDSTRTTIDAISSAIADAGYSVEGEKGNPQH